jgi:hypothetical protein
VLIFTEEGSFLTPWCHTRSGKRDPMASFQEEILEEMVAKSTDIDFLKSDKTSLTEDS